MDNDLIPIGSSPPEKGIHKIDKFKDHLVNGQKLTARDQAYFEKMKKAWSWSSKTFSPAQVVTMLYYEYGHEKTREGSTLQNNH